MFDLKILIKKRKNINQQMEMHNKINVLINKMEIKKYKGLMK